MPDDQDPAATSPASAPAESSSKDIAFDARRGAFLKLLIVNGLLNLITVGIYRFWARTNIRRFIWHHVKLLDDPLEYNGTGGELFLGFLIVIAVLFPMGLLYSLIRLAVPPDLTGLRIALEAVYYLALYGLLQIGFYRMWRYRMSRTAWRGIRFSLEGSSWAYLKLAFGWGIVTLMTLGIAYPWMSIELWRYQIEHTRLGRSTFKFEGNGRQVLVPWLITWVPFAVFAAGQVAVLFITIGLDATPNRIPGTIQENIGMLMTGTGLIWLGVIVLPFTILWYIVRMTRVQISGVSLDGSRLRSSLGYGQLLGFGAMAFCASVVVMLPLFFITVGLIASGGIDPSSMGSFVLIGIVAVFSVGLILPIIWMVIFKFEVITQTVNTIGIDDPRVLERVTQSSAAAPRTGEGLADALDLGGGF